MPPILSSFFLPRIGALEAVATNLNFQDGGPGTHQRGPSCRLSRLLCSGIRCWDAREGWESLLLWVRHFQKEGQEVSKLDTFQCPPPTAAPAVQVLLWAPGEKASGKFSLAMVLWHGLSIDPQSCHIHQGLIRGAYGLDGAPCLKGPARWVPVECDRSPVYMWIWREGFGCHFSSALKTTLNQLKSSPPDPHPPLRRTLQFSLEQHGFELHGSTYKQFFSNKYFGKIVGDLWQFEKTYKPRSLEISKKLRERYVTHAWNICRY